MAYIVKAVFGSESIVKTDTIYQYNSGQVLQVEGLAFTNSTEFHLAIHGKDTASIITGTIANNIAKITIPEVFMINDFCTCNYRIDVFVYVIDNDSGYTKYKIIIPVKSRPRPKDYYVDLPTVPELKSLKQELNTAVNNFNDAYTEIDQLKSETASLKEDIWDLTTTTKNILDSSDMRVGYCAVSGNIDATSTNYKYTYRYTEVNAGDVLWIHTDNNDPMVSGARFIAAYDKNKTIMPSSGAGATNITSYTVPSGVKYLRFTFYKDDGKIMVNTGEKQLPYEPYGRFVDWKSLMNVPLENVISNNDTSFLSSSVIYNVFNESFQKKGQLFDRKSVHVGYCSPSGYIDVESTNYRYTDPIYVKSFVGKKIHFSNDGKISHCRFITVYDENGNARSEYGLNDNKQNINWFTIPELAECIVITFYETEPNFQAELDCITDFSDYNPNEFEPNIDKLRFNDSILNGKKWAVCGDSFTDGVTDTKLKEGMYRGYAKTYPYFIGNRTGIEILDFFDGGKTLAYPTSGNFTNSLTCPTHSKYYQNIPEDVDYITIYLGINDSNHRTGSGTTADGEDTTGVIPIGTVDDTTTSTYGGAWNVVLSWLIENRPFAHIGIIVTNGCANSDYRDLQIAIARKYGIPFIDLNGDDRTPAMIRSQNPNIAQSVKNKIELKQRVSDTNTHPNDSAHEFESWFIENFLKSI